MSTRKVLSVVLSLIMIITALPLTAIFSFAEDENSEYIKSGKCGNDVTWVLDISKRELTISGNGNMYNYSYYTSAPWIEYKSYIDKVTIEDGVTSVGAYCFYGVDTLKSILLPDTVVSIGKFAFCNNSSLSEIALPQSIKTIDEYAFDYCRSISELTIPESVETIGNSAFNACRKLSKVTFLGNIKQINDCVFAFSWEYMEVEFYGDMPSFIGNPFNKTEATIIYPCENETWDEVLFSDFGGTLKWEKKHINDDYTAFEVDTDMNTVTGNCQLCGEKYTLKVDLISCVNSEFTLGVDTKVLQTLIISCMDNCDIKYRDAGYSGIFINDSFYGSVYSAVTIGKAGFHRLKVTGSEGGNSAFYSVFISQTHKPELDEAVMPTCTDTGLTEGSHCVLCDKVITTQEIVPALGHTVIIDEAIEPTEIEEGLTEGMHCSVCGEVLKEQEVIPPLENDNPIFDTVFGDVNEDGRVTVVDAKWVLQSVANSRILTREQKNSADVNGDGKVTVVDAKWILQSVAGMRIL